MVQVQVAHLPDTTTKQVTLCCVGDVAIKFTVVQPLVAEEVYPTEAVKTQFDLIRCIPLHQYLRCMK